MDTLSERVHVLDTLAAGYPAKHGHGGRTGFVGMESMQQIDVQKFMAVSAATGLARQPARPSQTRPFGATERGAIHAD